MLYILLFGKYTGEEANNLVNGGLLGLVSLLQVHPVVPEVLVVLLDMSHFLADCQLVPLYGGHLVDYPIDVDDAIAHQVVLGDILAPDGKAQQVGAAALEELVGELESCFREHGALLDVRHFVEAVHVALALERGEVAVLEEERQHVVAKGLLVGDQERGACGVPVDVLVCGLAAQHGVQLVEEGGHVPGLLVARGQRSHW